MLIRPPRYGRRLLTRAGAPWGRFFHDNQGILREQSVSFVADGLLDASYAMSRVAAADLVAAGTMTANYFVTTPGGGADTLIQTITDLGISAGLRLALDAGDIASWPGSGQKWLDTSGGGFDFYRGTGSGSDSEDPTFNGTPGGLTSAEFWGFDGGDSFAYDSANETWMQALHKASARYSWIEWIYFANFSALQPIFGTASGLNAGIGVVHRFATDGRARIRVRNASGNVCTYDTTMAAPSGGWLMVSGTVDSVAGVGGGFIGMNTTYETFDATYTSPTSSDAASVFGIGKVGSDINRINPGGRMSMFAMWEGAALSQANITDLFNATKGRYGL